MDMCGDASDWWPCSIQRHWGGSKLHSSITGHPTLSASFAFGKPFGIRACRYSRTYPDQNPQNSDLAFPGSYGYMHNLVMVCKGHEGYLGMLHGEDSPGLPQLHSLSIKFHMIRDIVYSIYTIMLLIGHFNNSCAEALPLSSAQAAYFKSGGRSAHAAIHMGGGCILCVYNIFSAAFLNH